MKSNLTLTFNNAAIATLGDTASEISLLDAMSGKVGTIKNIKVIMEIDELMKPEIPFIDLNKISTNPDPKMQYVAPPAKSNTAVASNVVKIEEFKIRKGSKVEKLFKALTTKGGVSFDKLKTDLGMTDGGVTSYLYGYTKRLGCTVETFNKPGQDKMYRLVKPDNVKLIYA